MIVFLMFFSCSNRIFIGTLLATAGIARKVAPLRSGHASRVFVESRAGARHKATDRLAPIAPCRRCRHACASRP